MIFIVILINVFGLGLALTNQIKQGCLYCVYESLWELKYLERIHDVLNPEIINNPIKGQVSAELS